MDLKDAISGSSFGIGIIVSGVGWFFGGYDGVLASVMIFMVIDVITGYLSAAYTNSMSSKKGFRGILKKFSYLLIIGVVSIIDTQILNLHGALRYGMLLWLIGNDGLSILENMAKMDVKLPEKLKEVLEIMQKRVDDVNVSTINLEKDNDEDEKV